MELDLILRLIHEERKKDGFFSASCDGLQSEANVGVQLKFSPRIRTSPIRLELPFASSCSGVSWIFRSQRQF